MFSSSSCAKKPILAFNDQLILPESFFCWSTIQFNKVDFPIPFGPRIAIRSPTSIEKLILFKTTKSSYFFDRFFTSKTSLYIFLFCLKRIKG